MSGTASTRDLTVGIVHSANALSQVAPATRLLRRIATVASKPTRTRIDARWARAREWSVAAACGWSRADGRVVAVGAVGALARWQRGRFAITSDPQLQLGSTTRRSAIARRSTCRCARDRAGARVEILLPPVYRSRRFSRHWTSRPWSARTRTTI